MLTISFAGCGNQVVNTSVTQASQTSKLNSNLPQVVATTNILCDLTKQVAGNTINLTCLVSPGANPHTYQPQPEDRKAIEQAKLIFYNGYNLEPSLLKIIKATKNPAPKIAVGQFAVPQPQKFANKGKKIADPHLWHNVKNTIRMVEVINNNLGKLAPSQVKNYSSKTKQITNELTQLDSWIKLRIATIPSKHRKLVTTHDALGYYVKAYGLAYTGTLKGVNTNAKLTDTREKDVVKNIQKAKVPTIFAETTINPNGIKSIAAKAAVRVSQRELYTDGLGKPGSDGETYQKMMSANTRTIVEGLGGTYLKFEPKVSQ
ncbi:metal ABC transporter solute-binding protein, Zn/Mn family [Cylindrospermum sp. FACHB-282]|uniref:metal ABC transporter solute-binding protein, Zn/Mn family n=1 Tax=Cylindrospermum sp. FACHB-282 TaxID=2692794 RepID=UPI0028168397|nr:zinc ABC transporter substrate-binding protein [Cylindrospermum sp. FACHB-282]